MFNISSGVNLSNHGAKCRNNCPKKANDSIVDIDTLVGVRHKKIIFEYDTVYIINKYGVSEFVRCNNDLKRLKNLSGSLNDLSINISTLQTDINAMYSNMQTVTAFINSYDRETKQKLEKLSADNLKLLEQMQKMIGELEEARQKIKAERWKSLTTKILWGAGGVTVGGLLFTSLWLLK